MATYSGNNDYLCIDGVDISAFWVEAQIVGSVGMQENTSGSSSYVTRIETTKDYTLTLKVVYDDDMLVILMPLIKPGKHRVIYGPEGNLPGKPKHDQVFLFPQVALAGNAEKNQKRVFDIQASGKAAPLFDMYEGGLF